jgi:hypothetical protein
LSSIISLVSFFIVLNVKESEKEIALIYLRDIIFFILSISLVIWSINNLFDLFQPFGNLTYSFGKGDDGRTVLNNYYFYLEEGNSIFPRFYSVFDEPGVLGTISTFLLFAFKYDLKNRKNLVIFIAACLTFSLAFYFLSFLGYFLLNIRKTKTLLISLSILCFMIIVYLFLNNFGESFDFLVVHRLKNFNDFGIDQRMSDSLNQYYSDFIQSKYVLFGMGSNFFSLNAGLLSGQGYRIFVIEYGYFGVFLIFILYSRLMLKLSWFNFICLLLFFLSFLQRPFLFTPWQIILFSIIISHNNLQLLRKT